MANAIEKYGITNAMPIITIAVITCTYHLLGTRRFSAPFRRSFFYWDWFSGSFSWSSSSIPPYKFIQHDCHAECPLSTRTPFPLCCFTLSANHSPAIKGKAQRSLLTLPRARAASNTCFALTQGKPKRRAFYTMSIRIPPAPLGICTASPSVTYLYS